MMVCSMSDQSGVAPTDGHRTRRRETASPRSGLVAESAARLPGLGTGLPIVPAAVGSLRRVSLILVPSVA